MAFRIFLVVLISALYSCEGSTFRASKGKEAAVPEEVKPTKGTAEFTSQAAQISVSEELAADFLFILDNSISMDPYYQRVKESILKIPVAKYPKNSKIAVMSK
jgi:hypothetical protein